MLCEKCNKRPAVVHIKKLINGVETDLHICQVCASEAFPDSVNPFGAQIDFLDGFSDMLAGFSSADSDQNKLKKTKKHCEKCGSTYRNFQNSGRLGCDNCYKTFEKELSTLLRRLQGSIQHSGKSPRGMEKYSKIDSLKQELKKCINTENYERAAVIRDKIKELKNKTEE